MSLLANAPMYLGCRSQTGYWPQCQLWPGFWHPPLASISSLRAPLRFRHAGPISACRSPPAQQRPPIEMKRGGRLGSYPIAERGSRRRDY